MIVAAIAPSLRAGSPFSTPTMVVGVLSLCVGIWVLLRERAKPTAVSFMASVVGVGFYQLVFSRIMGAGTAADAQAWARAAYVGVPFIVPTVYQFSMELLGLRQRRRAIVLATWLVGVAYVGLSVGTDLLLSGVTRHPWGYYPVLSLYNLPILSWNVVVLACAIRDFATSSRGADRVQRARIRWIAIPMAVAMAAFTDYLPAFGVNILPIGFAFIPIYLAGAAWAVARYHLPDITAAFAADQILRTMAEPLLVSDEAGAIAIANPAACRLLGHDAGTLRGRHLAAVFGETQAAIVLSDVLVEWETSMAGGDGDSIDVAVSTSRLLGGNGRTIGTVVVARDIRERRRAEEALRRSEQHFRALIENAQDTITIVDAQGSILYESPSVRQVLGYEGPGPRENIFSRAHEDEREIVAEVFSELVRRPGSSTERELRVRHAHGGHRWFSFRGKNLLDNPAVGGIVLNGRDITEERQLHAELEQSQKMEAIGRLAGGVAHDFNNILTAIQGNIALLEEEIGAHSPISAELAEVRIGAERAARLTDQLLAFSRRQVVRPEVLDLNEVVADMRSMLVRLIGEEIRLETEAADSALVRVDRGNVEQVLMNLVVNARDAMPQGGMLRVATASGAADASATSSLPSDVDLASYVRLTVTDTGAGMDEATRSRIFEPFFTTKPPGKGTGLGLSTVYGTVRQNGGFLGVESRPGCGTCFTVYLPRLQPPASGEDVAAQRPASPAIDPVAGDTPGATVLVVEDEAPVRTLIQKVLRRRGYHVLEAEHGEAALALAAAYEGPIHLLITDLVMPGIGGRETAEQLVALRPSLETIFVSGYTEDEVVRRGIVAGQHRFLSKPFTPSALAARVREVLRAGSAP